MRFLTSISSFAMQEQRVVILVLILCCINQRVCCIFLKKSLLTCKNLCEENVNVQHLRVMLSIFLEKKKSEIILMISSDLWMH